MWFSSSHLILKVPSCVLATIMYWGAKLWSIVGRCCRYGRTSYLHVGCRKIWAGRIHITQSPKCSVFFLKYLCPNTEHSYMFQSTWVDHHRGWHTMSCDVSRENTRIDRHNSFLTIYVRPFIKYLYCKIVCCKNRTKHTNTHCCKVRSSCTVQAAGTCNDQGGL
jgi:hypothetical protein